MIGGYLLQAVDLIALQKKLERDLRINTLKKTSFVPANDDKLRVHFRNGYRNKEDIYNLKPMLSVKGFTNDSVIMEQGLGFTNVSVTMEQGLVVDELTFGFQDLRTCPEITIFKYIGRYFGI
ncbi:hypothetical protein L345_08244, partial [Ophiophagus hannah]